MNMNTDNYEIEYNNLNKNEKELYDNIILKNNIKLVKETNEDNELYYYADIIIDDNSIVNNRESKYHNNCKNNHKKINKQAIKKEENKTKNYKFYSKKLKTIEKYSFIFNDKNISINNLNLIPNSYNSSIIIR